MHINSFNHFRAIAIIFIIAGHSFGVTGLEIDGILSTTANNLIKGNTALFVFISGFLFHHIYYPKFQYQRFINNKIKNVLAPYLILGFIPVCLYVYIRKEGFDGYFLPTGEGGLLEVIIPTLKYYASGRFLNAYWYIPFIMLVFLSSPLHVSYTKLNLKTQMYLIVFLSMLSMYIHRPFYNISALQSLIYYTPIYFIGITASIHRSTLYQYFTGKELLLLIAAVSIAFCQALQGDIGNYHKDPFTYGGIDTTYIQKLFLCFFFMILLNRFESYTNKYVHSVASTSFTAFFLHPFVIVFLKQLNLSFLNQNSWFFYILFVLILAVSCVAIAKITKKIIPKYSRYLIGY